MITITAKVSVEYDTEEERAQIEARVPPGLNPVIDLVLKKIEFTVVQEVSSLG